MSHLSAAEENNEVPDDSERFKYRHNHPYRRHPRPGDFGVRRSTPSTPAPSTPAAPALKAEKGPGYQSSLASRLGYHQAVSTSTQAPPGPFVTVAAMMEAENVTQARQPKVAKYEDFSSGSGSNRHEIRVLPPDEFHHLLARVDGVDRKVPPSAKLQQCKLNFSHSRTKLILSQLSPEEDREKENSMEFLVLQEEIFQPWALFQ